MTQGWLPSNTTQRESTSQTAKEASQKSRLGTGLAPTCLQPQKLPEQGVGLIHVCISRTVMNTHKPNHLQLKS